MAAPKVTLYLDIVSPFSYLAYYITRVSGFFHMIDPLSVQTEVAGLP